jgi:hypothetical protein
VNPGSTGIGDREVASTGSLLAAMSSIRQGFEVVIELGLGFVGICIPDQSRSDMSHKRPNAEQSAPYTSQQIHTLVLCSSGRDTHGEYEQRLGNFFC